jgi:hypothetical protein
MNRRTLLNLTCSLLIAAGASTLAQAQDVAKVPDGMVAIHYNRPAGDYDGWGVHLWESYDKVVDGKPVPGSKSKSDKPLEGVTWMAPMKPTGKDAFGVYWHVKADEFRNTKVNFIIHKGDSKDCPRDLYFISTQTKQIFVNQGNCDFFASADEAVKARKK